MTTFLTFKTLKYFQAWPMSLPFNLIDQNWTQELEKLFLGYKAGIKESILLDLHTKEFF